MSKRTRAEIQALNEEKYNKGSDQFTKFSKMAKNAHKEKSKNYKYSDFPELPLLEVNDKTKWVRKSHNKDKQLEEFIKFTYFKYQAPLWCIEFIKSMIKASKDDSYDFRNNFPELKKDNYISCVLLGDLVQACQLGKGFKELLNSCLTKKEIHYFLNSKENTLTEALLDAKLADSTLNKRTKNWFLDRADTFSDYFKTGHRTIRYNLIQYSIKHNLDSNEVQEISDYVTNYRVGGYFTRSFRDGSELMTDENGNRVRADDFFKKGLGTIIKLSNDWHLVQQNLKQNKFVQWEKTYEDFEINGYEFSEISDNRALSDEGKKMGHCVGSYASRCVSGKCQIISMKHIGQRLITIEINNRKIVQVRGKYNRSANSTEENFIKRYAAERNLMYV